MKAVLALAAARLGGRFAARFPDGGLELRRGPSAWRWLSKILVSLFFLPFLLLPAALVVDGAVPIEPVSVLFLLLWYGLLAAFVAMLSRAFGRWRLVRLDRVSGELELRQEGRLLWLSRRLRIPFHRLERLELLAGAEAGSWDGDGTEEEAVGGIGDGIAGAGDEARVGIAGEDRSEAEGPDGTGPAAGGGDVLAFSWTFRYRAGPDAGLERGRAGRARTLEVPLAVEGVDRRAEALDLSCRAAEMLGLEAVTFGRRDHLALEVDFTRGGGDRAVDELVRLDERPRYAEDAGMEGVEVPAAELPPFPADGPIGLYEVIAWEPGRRVELEVKPWTLRQQAVAAVVAALFFGAPVAFLAFALALGLPDPARPWLVSGLAATGLTLVLVVAFLLWRARRSRSVRLDWGDGELRVSEGAGERRAALGDVDRLEVRGVRSQRRAGGTTHTSYRCRVMAVLASGERWELLETGTDGGPDGPYRTAGAAADELAAALGVPWRWRGYEG